MSKARDLTGQRFGLLVVIGREGRNHSGHALWKCRCDCGNISLVATSNLKSGHTQSCGCMLKNSRYKHGYAENDNPNRLYSIWKNMIDRCHNEKAHSFSNYGARGITVCEEWRKDINSFVLWAQKNGYSDDLTIDRIDNEKGYSPDNCRWADQSTQCNNKRNNILIEYKGEKKTLSQWCCEFGIPFSLAQKRYHYGWSAERIFNEPVHHSDTGTRGVTVRKYKDSVRYRAYIYVNKKRVILGTYKTLEEAIAARKAAEEKYRGKKEGD